MNTVGPLLIFQEALDASDIIGPRPQVRHPVGRHNARGTDLRHMPCGIKPTRSPVLKPLKKKIARKALAMSTAVQEDASPVSESTSSTQSDAEKAGAKPQEVFMTEVAEETKGKALPQDTLQDLQGKLKALREAAAAEAAEQKRPKSAQIKAEKPKKDWDAFLVSQLSQLTATWIVHERMTPTKEREELQKTLESWYGKPKYTDLVQEDASESEGDFDLLNKDKKVKPKKKWKREEES